MSKLPEETSSRRLINRFWDFIKYGSINTVTLIPPLTAMLIVVAWGIIKENFFRSSPQIYNSIVIGLAAMLIGLDGVIYIYRKEMPGPVSSVTVKGGCAIVSGYILLLFFWILGILGIVFEVMEVN